MSPSRGVVDALMKRCQIGVGGRDALEDAHDVMAECYGTLGALMLEVERLTQREPPFGYGIIFGDNRQHRCLVLDRAKAEAKAGTLHGVRLALYADPAEMDALKLVAAGGIEPPTFGL